MEVMPQITQKFVQTGGHHEPPASGLLRHGSATTPCAPAPQAQVEWAWVTTREEAGGPRPSLRSASQPDLLM